ncbi:hypothetical protein MRX96_018272 [Rhipicephalus microplus]
MRPRMTTTWDTVHGDLARSLLGRKHRWQLQESGTRLKGHAAVVLHCHLAPTGNGSGQLQLLDAETKCFYFCLRRRMRLRTRFALADSVAGA